MASFKLCLCLFLLVVLTDAARKINVSKRMMEGLNRYRMMKRTVDDTDVDVADILGLTGGEGLDEGEREQTASGTQKVKITESYLGVPIVDQAIVVEQDSSGQYTGNIAGNLLEGVSDDVETTEPDLTPDEALDIALAHRGFSRDDIDVLLFVDVNEDVELKIATIDIGEDEARAKLVYEVNYLIENEARLSRPYYLIDAVGEFSGTIIDTWEGMNMISYRKLKARGVEYDEDRTQIFGVGGNAKIGKVTYGIDQDILDVGERCVLENEAVVVHHSQHYFSWDWGYTLDTISPYAFDCEDGPQDEVNGAYSAVNDAYVFTTAIAEMWDERYGETPLETRIYARVHFGEGFENAFWDGKTITFGDGQDYFYPLVCVDVTAHEIGHGVTTKHSNLIYRGESGGMNEAFSDMMGETVKYYVRNESDWLMGADIFKGEGQALRYMADPPMDGKSIGHYSDYCPGIDVHYSSGIGNKAFYLLATTDGWDILKAFDVFYLANKMYWHPSAKFYETACGAKLAAQDLGHNPDDVVAAFRAVGVEACEPVTTGFLALSDLKAGNDSEIIFTANVPEGLSAIEFRTTVKYAWGFDLEGEADLYVTSSRYEFNSQNNGSFERIDICNPVGGEHIIRIHAHQEFALLTLSASTGGEVVQEISTNRSQQIDIPYVITEELLADYPSIAFQLTCTEGYADLGLRKDKQVDFWNWEWDYIANYIGDNTVEALMCRPTPGLWYLSVITWWDGYQTECKVIIKPQLSMTRIV